MAVSRVHSRYLVQLDWATPSVPVSIGAITQQQLRADAQVRGEAQSGEIYRRFLSLVEHKSTARFGTLQLAVALAQCGLTGHVIENNGVNFFAQKYTEGSTPASGSVHRKYNLQEGVMVPRTITCDHRGDAELIYECFATYDGVNAPIAETDTSALPTAVLDAERFTLGPVTIGSVTIDHLTRLEIDFGLNVLVLGSDSDVYDTWCCVRGIAPRITLRGIDIEWLKAANIPLGGKAATHLTTKIYLRKRTHAGTYVIDATAEHIKFTADGMAVLETLMEENGENPAECSLSFPLRYDGTNAPIVITTASAIT